MSVPLELAATIVSREAPIKALLELDLLSGPKRVWAGFGKLQTIDGRQWDGIGDLGSIDAITQSFSASAPAGRITVSGVSPAVIAAAANATEYKDRLIRVYLQAFQGRALYGDPASLAMRVMKSLEISRDAGVRSVAVTHESPYFRRRSPPAAWYSDRDQQKRHPGDRFCERVPFLLFKRDDWPHYN